MNYITDTDYKSIIGEAALKAVSQVDAENRRRAESAALEEVAGYLRPAYDAAAEFGKQGIDRNEHLVMIVCDVSLYHLSASLPNRLGAEVRKERYERAVKWLEDVQRGRIVPALARPDVSSGGTPEGGNANEMSTSAGTFSYGGGRRQNNMW